MTHTSAPTTTFILSLDIGSSSVRALLFDQHGHAVAGVNASEKVSIHTAPDGTAEIDADALLALTEQCIDTALAQAGAQATQIIGVGVDTLVSNIIALDADDKPLTPLITYADTRNDSDAVALRKQLDERATHERTGCLLRTSYWPARLAWLKRTQPTVWQTARRWITFGEYVELRLFGQCHVSYSAASWSGLLDRHTLAWDAPLLKTLDLAPEKLSPLVDVSDPQRGLHDTYARRWPALRDVPWFPAIGDGAAANVGSGCLGPDRVALTIGTTGAVRMVLGDQRPTTNDDSTRSPIHVPSGLWCYRVDGRRVLLGGATTEGGNVYAWMQHTLQLDTPDKLEAQIAALAPDAHGLTILPLFAGERSPGWAGHATATISGLTLHTTPIDIARAALESIAYRFAIIAELLFADDQQPTTGDSISDHAARSTQHAANVTQPSASRAPRTFIASGGALTSSPTWMQILADVLQRPVVASAEPEATSRGVALLALESLKLAALDTLPHSDGAMYTPNPQHAETYRAAIARQKQMYSTLITSQNDTMTE